MLENVYKRKIIKVVHPDGRDMTIRIVFITWTEFVFFLDKHFDKGFKINKGKKSEATTTVYLSKQKDKSLPCSVK